MTTEPVVLGKKALLAYVLAVLQVASAATQASFSAAARLALLQLSIVAGCWSEKQAERSAPGRASGKPDHCSVDA